MGASPILAQNYIVQKGDSLFSIGQKFGNSVGELNSANQMQTNTIYPGQKLWIPEGSVYIVKPGDTLSLIAQRHTTTYGELKRVNGLSSNVIYPGQKLYVPSQKSNYLPSNGYNDTNRKDENATSKSSRYILGFYVETKNMNIPAHTTR